MQARYLRVKNWRKHQHYKDRRPPWIKLLRELIDGDNGRQFREELSEAEQWQLVRLWLYASGSDVTEHDQDGNEIPLIRNDEKLLRIGIRSAKRIPLEKFVRLGFLEPAWLSQNTTDLASTHASTSASTHANPDASADPSKTASTNGSPPARARRAEDSELTTRAVTELHYEPPPHDDNEQPPDLDIDYDTILRDIA